MGHGQYTRAARGLSKEGAGSAPGGVPHARGTARAAARNGLNSVEHVDKDVGRDGTMSNNPMISRIDGG